ncbi:MAG: hypothetical protein A2096_08805 [Spirochaetes bacterium GWF1_41_5]|nr:MAG: hypothetical protein A2096_08805 [Spirochaetes bacterium GWF1_41_5]
MSLVNSCLLVKKAWKEHYAVPAFNIANYESMLAVLDAADEMRSPVILQIYERLFCDERPRHLACLAADMKRDYKISFGLHLDHGKTLLQAKSAAAWGYTSIMLDGSILALKENINLLRQGKKIALKNKIGLEAELGRVGAGEADASYYTDPDEAAVFVLQTKIDMLAPAVGTAHGFYKSEPRLDFSRLEKINKLCSVPLVLHGGTGVSDEQLKEAIKYGIAKINIATELQNAFQKAVEHPAKKFLPLDLFLTPGVEAMKECVRRKIAVCGSEGKC